MGSANKQRERFFLDQFLEIQGISPISVQQFDPPDFLIDLEGRKVGIEVTELFIRTVRSKAHHLPTKDILLQELESITDRIVSKAREIYLNAGNPLVLSTIVFSNRITVDQNRDQISELIAHQIQIMNLPNSQKAQWRSSEDEYGHPLSESVTYIHSYRVPERRFARWTVARAGLVTTLTPKHIQEEIGKKAKKLDAYKKHAEEIWLLIVADRTRPSQQFSDAPDFPLDSVSSPFTKTFYYDYVRKRVIDLTNTTGVPE